MNITELFMLASCLCVSPLTRTLTLARRCRGRRLHRLLDVGCVRNTRVGLVGNDGDDGDAAATEAGAVLMISLVFLLKASFAHSLYYVLDCLDGFLLRRCGALSCFVSHFGGLGAHPVVAVIHHHRIASHRIRIPISP